VATLPAITATGAATRASRTTATARPAATATRRASATPGATATAEPTSTLTAEARTNGATETLTLLWAPEAPLVDSDDIEEIIAALKTRPGILDGSGSEMSLSLTYDPAIISAGRIIVIMRGMGYPVVRP
jgi:hypothetical protein